jgi:hypothetical protein
MLTQKLLARGDRVAIEKGQVVIRPKSGKRADGWLKDNAKEIYKDVITQAGLDALQYTGYSTGYYTQYKAGGITLQYSFILTGESCHVVFNADLKRARGKQRGQLLPKGQFRVSKSHAFTRFWVGLGLNLPKRLSGFHDCMGKLKSVVITGTVDNNNRILKETIKPLEMSHEKLTILFNTAKSPDNYPTITRQLPDNYPTRTPDKESSKTQPQQAIKSDSSTCANEYELSNQGITYNRSHVTSLPIQQSNEEWWNDYDGVAK